MLEKNSYSEVLEAAWGQHLIPKAADAPTVISLFAGCGGSSLGYSMAGFRELLAVEWDNNAVETFKLNFPTVPVFHDDICNLTVSEALRLSGLKEGELDVLDGSPPCQGFSTAGKRKFTDGRNQLFIEYVRLLRGLKPKVFVMENVSGMVKGKMKLVFAEIMQELKMSGYNVRAWLLNAKYFDVPQSRERMLIIGTIDRRPSIPRTSQNNYSIGDGLQGLGVSELELKPALLKESWQMWRVLQGSERGKHFGLVKTRWNRPCPTIVRDAGNTCTGLIHPSSLRRMAIPELKRLASFPDAFQLAGSYKERWARIGNSVPPLFMKAIAEHIRTELLEKAAEVRAA